MPTPQHTLAERGQLVTADIEFRAGHEVTAAIPKSHQAIVYIAALLHEVVILNTGLITVTNTRDTPPGPLATWR